MAVYMKETYQYHYRNSSFQEIFLKMPLFWNLYEQYQIQVRLNWILTGNTCAWKDKKINKTRKYLKAPIEYHVGLYEPAFAGRMSPVWDPWGWQLCLIVILSCEPVFLAGFSIEFEVGSWFKSSSRLHHPRGRQDPSSRGIWEHAPPENFEIWKLWNAISSVLGNNLSTKLKEDFLSTATLSVQLLAFFW